MKYLLFTLILLLSVLVLPELVMAQPPTFPGPPPQAPILGGLALLAAGGATYAIYKLRNKKK